MEYIYEAKQRKDGILAHVKSGIVFAADKAEASRKARAKVNVEHAIISVTPTYYTNVHRGS
jgi:hypothetical protein